MKNKPLIFISYHSDDQLYTDLILAQLNKISEKYPFTVLTSQDIEIGESDRSSIRNSLEKHIQNARAALILISPSYLSSQWNGSEELSLILDEHTERGLRAIPIIIDPSYWVDTPLVYHQLLPKDGRPLSALSRTEQYEVLRELTDEVLAALYRPKSTQKTFNLLETNKWKWNGDKHKEAVPILKEPTMVEGKEKINFFVSHSKNDGDFAEILKFRLEGEGFFAWIDTDVLEAGMDWRQEIDNAILSSKAVILILSPESKKSEYVTYEWAFALGSGIKIVPVMLKETPIHPRLEIFQYLDFTNRRARPWPRLISRLQALADSKEAL